jgi:hypothetical protein
MASIEASNAILREEDRGVFAFGVKVDWISIDYR